MEDYLEVIYRLAEDAGRARVSEIADAIHVRRPSVSKALRRLAETGYVDHDPYGDVVLTESGERVARRQVRNHRVVSRFLTSILGLSREEADHEACQIEHTAGPTTVRCMEGFLDFVANAPETHRRWLRGFAHESTLHGDEGSDSPRGSAVSPEESAEFVDEERSWSSPV
jgi:DtxR family Mn-dependent transcriptional regulator